MDDDVWLDVIRRRDFLNEAEEDSREYLRFSIYGYINSYYLEVARPGSDTNKVHYFGNHHLTIYLKINVN